MNDLIYRTYIYTITFMDENDEIVESLDYTIEQDICETPEETQETARYKAMEIADSVAMEINCASYDITLIDAC